MRQVQVQRSPHVLRQAKVGMWLVGFPLAGLIAPGRTDRIHVNGLITIPVASLG